MFTRPTQYLAVHLPSPTTVSFTVTTRRPGSTGKSASTARLRKSHVVEALKWSLRLLIALGVVLVNLVKVQGVLTPGGWAHRVVGFWIRCLWLGVGCRSAAQSVADEVAWWVLIPLSLLVSYLCLRRDYVEETLLVLQGLGVQTSTTSPYFFVSPTTTFIPTTQIQDIVIHEAFKGLEVRFYLAIIVGGATEVVVVFPTLLPRRDILEEVWRGARKCLYTGIR